MAPQSKPKEAQRSEKQRQLPHCPQLSWHWPRLLVFVGSLFVSLVYVCIPVFCLFVIIGVFCLFVWLADWLVGGLVVICLLVSLFVCLFACLFL